MSQSWLPLVDPRRCGRVFSRPDLVLDAVVGEIAGRIVFFRSLAFDIFADGFEGRSTGAWSGTVPEP